MSFFLLLTITYPPARRDATASADMVPIGELSAVDTAFLDLVPLLSWSVADALLLWLHPDQNLSGRRLPYVPSAPGVPVGVSFADLN